MGIGQPVLRLYPPKSWLLSVQTNQNFPTLKTAVPVSCLVSAQKIQAKKKFFFFFGCVCRKLRHADQRSRLFLLRTTSDPALKKEHFRPKLVFSIFPAKILSRPSRLSRTTSDLTRLIRPRPIDCDRGSEQTVKIFLMVFALFFEHRQKKFFNRIPDLELIYTPKEAHSRMFVTGGSFFVRQMVAKKNNSSFLARLQCQYCAGYKNTIYTYF